MFQDLYPTMWRWPILCDKCLQGSVDRSLSSEKSVFAYLNSTQNFTYTNRKSLLSKISNNSHSFLCISEVTSVCWNNKELKCSRIFLIFHVFLCFPVSGGSSKRTFIKLLQKFQIICTRTHRKTQHINVIIAH